jgi:hypothetical protein
MRIDGFVALSLAVHQVNQENFQVKLAHYVYIDPFVSDSNNPNISNICNYDLLDIPTGVLCLCQD